ncbi:MAG: 5-methyltetrahydropteroyltriglutamate--homocysteine S-methyltransferase [Helicobacteraceae bacterium]|jgi:5-methyltetrahydropteroyltriglutamate--homocysteine methyltransferase|nr:5-methyltetrahydropteroyltriglutamate--homocysteine S-methyltransferase [Helicobacteraceae bacterium]
MLTSIVGYPRIGAKRELKFWTEDYFKGNLDEAALLENAKKLRSSHWQTQRESQIDLIPSGDFSFYDGVLDTAFLLGAIPKRYRDLKLGALETYFAMARGYQGEKGDVKALSMRKWFNTNYHYIVPEIDEDAQIRLCGEKPFDEFLEAKAQGIATKPVLIGPFTFLKLAKITSARSDPAKEIFAAYAEIFDRFQTVGATWLQLDEPILVTDLDEKEVSLFHSLYSSLLDRKGSLKILLQTYFGDVRDCYREITGLGFDGIGLDFAEGAQSLSLVQKHGFPNDKILFAGVVNGKNIWKNRFEDSMRVISELKKHATRIGIGSSCSLLHVPYTTKAESGADREKLSAFAFAEEKLKEVSDLKTLAQDADFLQNPLYTANLQSHGSRRGMTDESVRARVSAITEDDFTRTPNFEERAAIQKEALNLPLLPTTTIGSFPQTKEVKLNRSSFKKGEITAERYQDNLKEMIAQCVKLQEEIGLDVLVHGEFERNDMVEYFGENLFGFFFTKQGWVQSYGTRCVKPPIVWGDVKRERPFTVDTIRFAQSLTSKPVKGMLTGPVTILNWSFPREDISARESAIQIALAIRDEVLDLERAGIRVIQIDEAAIREKLPLRKSDWHSGYLSWAIPAFRLTHSGVRPSTQIHTHMCYSEFQDIISDIDAMDADVISFEAARSNLEIVKSVKNSGFKTAVGPGVYDIHSPRVPSKEEIESVVQLMLDLIPAEKLWINPDCGLKTRGTEETTASLKNLTAAAVARRGLLSAARLR